MEYHNKNIFRSGASTHRITEVYSTAPGIYSLAGEYKEEPITK